MAATGVATPKPNSRSKAAFARLERLSLPALLFAGAALTLGPKRLAITLLVTASISAADVSDAEAVTLSLLYVVIATTLVTLPVVLAIVFARTPSVDERRPVVAHGAPSPVDLLPVGDPRGARDPRRAGRAADADQSVRASAG